MSNQPDTDFVLKLKNCVKVFTDDYCKLINENKIKATYKIINVDYLEPTYVKSMVDIDPYFVKSPIKKEMVNDMLKYYFNHKDIMIYKKTDYLCNAEEQVCICVTRAEDFKKIFDGENYKPGNKYISWFNVNYKYKFLTPVL